MSKSDFEDGLAENYKNTTWSAFSPACSVIYNRKNTDDGCYCCCMPYIPNPDTKICERLMDFVRKRGNFTSPPT
uniref:Uncharacterized protein n=1 Tax=Romanomermis culicivorax TaxID=13658 RepID=A0A915IM97_ROMCU